MSAEPEVVLAKIRWSGCGPHLVSQYSQFIGDPLPHQTEASVVREAAAWRQCDPGSSRLETTLARLF